MKPHGMKNTPTYNSWKAMRKRCLNARHDRWGRYGGRGITVCDRWSSFENFLADMGVRPVGTTLDRIDNDGPYSPENCRWATTEQQANNRSTNVFIEWGGRRQTVSQWAHALNVNEKKLRKRMAKMPLDEAMTFARGVSTEHRLLEHEGRVQSLKSWAREIGICPKTLRQRLERWPLPAALGTPAIKRVRGDA